MYLECIGLSEYENFARRHFENSGRKIEQGVVADIYDRFDGVTWYVQKMLNMLYGITPERGECRAEMIPEALGNILDSYKYTYQEILFRLPERQKEPAYRHQQGRRCPCRYLRGVRSEIQSAFSEFGAGGAQRIARKGFRYARAGRLPHLRQVFRDMAQ